MKQMNLLMQRSLQVVFKFVFLNIKEPEKSSLDLNFNITGRKAS